MDEGVPKEKVKIRNLQLTNNGVTIEIGANSSPSNSTWLGFLKNLQLNTWNFVSIEKRSKLSYPNISTFFVFEKPGLFGKLSQLNWC